MSLQPPIAISNAVSVARETLEAIATTTNSTRTLEDVKQMIEKASDAIRNGSLNSFVELANKINEALEIVAVNAESQVMIAKVRKQAITLVAGIKEEATIGVKAAHHGLDNTAMLNTLGGLNTQKRANERASGGVKPKKRSAGMVYKLIHGMERVRFIAEGNQSSSADKKLANELETKMLETVRELGIPIVSNSNPLENQGTSTRDAKKKKGKKKGRKGKGRTKAEEPKTEETTETISDEMRKALLENLRDKGKSVDIWKKMVDKYPESATIRAIAVGDEAIFLQEKATIRELISPTPEATTTSTHTRKPQAQGQKR